MINTFSGRLAALVLALFITSAFAAPFAVVTPPTAVSHQASHIAKRTPAPRLYLFRAIEPVS